MYCISKKIIIFTDTRIWRFLEVASGCLWKPGFDMDSWLVSLHPNDSCKWIYYLPCLSLSILTMAGNWSIIFLVCSKRQLRTKTKAFVVSLAAADFCVGMSVVPPMFICEIATGCTRQLSWIIFLRLLLSYVPVMNLCSLVVDRYIVVVEPFKYLTFMTRRLVVQMVSVSWGIPIDQFRYIKI